MDRRSFTTLLFACLAGRLAAAAALPEDEVRVSHPDERYIGELSYRVPVAADIAWEVLTDFDHMAEFVPGLDSSHVLSREGETVVVVQHGRIAYGPFTFAFDSQRRVEMHMAEGLLVAHAVAGSARSMASEMHVTPEAGGTRLDYHIEMIPGRWYPASVGISILRRQLAEQFSAMGREMLRRAEARHSSQGGYLNGCCRRMVSSRSGPVETMAMGTSHRASRRAR